MSKIKGIAETYAQINALSKQLESQTSENINDLRYGALKKIDEYLNEIANDLQGLKISFLMENSDVWRLCDKAEDYMIYFNANTFKSTGAYGDRDTEICPWFIRHKRNGYKAGSDSYWAYIDGKIEFEEYKKMYSSDKEIFDFFIEHWAELKPFIESQVENKVREKIAEKQNEAEKINNSYMSVVDFEV